MKSNKLFMIILAFLLCISLALAGDPYRIDENIEMGDKDIYNASDINSTHFWQSGYAVLDTSSPVNESKINQSNLNVNSSTYWNLVSDWLDRWFYRSGITLYFNDTLLNETIDDKVSSSNASIKEYIDNQDAAINTTSNIEELGFNTTVDLETYFDTLYVKIVNLASLILGHVGNFSEARDNIAFKNESNIFTEKQTIDDDLNVTGNITGDIFIDYLTDDTYKTLQDWIDTTQSAGLLSGGAITGNSDNTINVSAGQGFIKTTNNALGNSVFFNWSRTDNIELATNNTKYRVYVDYNSGVPEVKVTTSTLNFNDNLGIGTTEYESYPLENGTPNGHLHYSTAGTQVYNLARRIQKTLRAQGFNHVSGAIIGGRGLNFTLTAGAFDGGLNRFTQSSFDSNTTTFGNYYYNGSIWIHTPVNIINNTKYNDITSGLVELTANRYGVHWVYLDVIHGDVAVIYGRGDYTLANAQASKLPASLPNYLVSYGVNVGRIIVKKGTTSFTEVVSAFDVTFGQSAAQLHNELGGIDGGTAGEYYHLTSAQHINLVLFGAENLYQRIAGAWKESNATVLLDNATIIRSELNESWITDNQNDETGGWTNTSAQTTTALDVGITGSLNSTDNATFNGLHIDKINSTHWKIWG